MDIRILGPGCARCHEVKKRTINALAEMNFGADVQKIADFEQIAAFGVFATPALVVNGKVRCVGRIPSQDEIKRWIQEEMHNQQVT